MMASLQTPDVSRSRSSPSWIADLDAYLASHEGSPGSSKAIRVELASRVKCNVQSAEAWRDLLAYEELHGGNITHSLQLGETDNGRVSLYHIYYWATQLVPRSKNQHKDAYLQLWLGFTRQQWMRSQEDARDTFKTLKNQLVGDGSARLYFEWASLEHAAGNVSKALGIIAKGLRSDAQPASLLEQLRLEMQSGTFDLKTAGNYTETLTIDANSAAAKQLQQPLATPAPSTATAIRTNYTAVTSSRLTSASCLKGATTANCASAPHMLPEHAGRAVTFAADVVDVVSHEHVRRPGLAGLHSNLTTRTTDVHTGCLSTCSTSSRSTTSVHDGTLPFSAGAVSFKSSTTETSGMESTEEDTISCQASVGGAAAPHKDAGGTKPSTAPLSSQTAQGSAATSSNTATIGLKRFGFKSRALRVGGADSMNKEGQAQAPATSATRSAQEPEVLPATAAASHCAIPSSTAAAAAEGGAHDDTAAAAAAGRKRRAGETCSPPGKVLLAPATACRSSQNLARDADGATMRVTDKSSGWQHGVVTSSPVDGQLPSSVDNTPEPAMPSKPHHTSPELTTTAAPASTTFDGCHGAQYQSRAESVTAGSSHKPRQSSEEGLEHSASRKADAAQTLSDEQPPPTVRLSGPSDAPPSAGMRPSSALNSSMQPQQPSHSTSASTREPLRPLQPQLPVRTAVQDQPKMLDQLQLEKAIAPSAREHKQSDGSLQQQPQPQQCDPRQQQLMGPPPPVQQVQQQQAVRQSRPREDAQTVYVQGTRYTKLECVGRGGSSKVFKVMGPNCKIYALKRIRLAGRDAEAASGFIDEINLLLRLKNKPNIIQLVDSQVFQAEGLIYMVQEYGEIDLARLLAKHDAARRAATGTDAAHGGLLKDNLDENFIRLYWQQMLQAVSGVHEQRIVHSDLKPANFLLVEGQLKLIDFGIAKAINGDTTSIARESQVGTLNYMSPEAILGGSNNILGGPAMKVGRPSDVWSLGCILYQMVYGRTPFADLPFLPKMHAICNPQHQVAYPDLANADLLNVMKRCLDRDPKTRITLQELLEHPFLHPNRRRVRSPPAAPAVGLSEEQMKLLVAQVAAAGAAGVTDIDKLTKDLMLKLGTTVKSSKDENSSSSSRRGHQQQQ